MQKNKNILVLGSGFAAFSFLKKLNRNLFTVTVISKRNHFLFTPLLPQTTVGTIEFRSIIEPVRNLQKIRFIQSECKTIRPDNKSVICEDTDTKKIFSLYFDVLVIAVGEVTNTYGIPGVWENALFLKELSDARKIRNKVIDCFENASLPELSETEKQKHLTFVVCGGGPTGVEFVAELHDFIEDVKKKYGKVANLVKIYLIEAKQNILSTFDETLSRYTMKIFSREKIILKTNSQVIFVSNNHIILNDSTSIEYGLLVWATGNSPTSLVKDTPFQKSENGKIFIDRNFRVKKDDTSFYENIFAIGDCATIEGQELPATAQVAQQQGYFLAKRFNKPKTQKGFKPRKFGMLAYIGNNKALADTTFFKSSGFLTFLFWRTVYLTKLVSLKNKILVLFDWSKTILFGRDISNF
ncbi:MAG: FAD-dependent oxidoreductase [Ignavibacteria bacterium]